MKTIPLTQGKVAFVDDEDYERLRLWKWHAAKCVRKNRVIWYARRAVPGQRGKLVLMHREIAVVAGISQVDHQDGDGLNNQQHNLRPATNAQNAQNKRKHPGCRSRFKGVTWSKYHSKWAAQLEMNGKHRHLGYFAGEQDAADAYDCAAEQFFKEFALTNSKQ